ncbi:similar to transcription factor CBF/MAK21 [Botrytis cinerea T4]|uniref:Similar to transcription factor CBF/MAK21 n=1 Tax=Botryotinia fuckeliana (strain T4) TaxID=999810 RepID=G2YB58_BOTF4|nr:similar to transcription factor CBF/MAK21 [Botrytis cinerea T4]
MVSNNKKRKRDTNKEDQDRQVNKAPKSGGSEKEVLLQEILALGGTEEDLDLVLDAQSDSENEAKPTTKSKDKDFKNEFAKFVAGLGIEGQAPEAEADEEDEEGDADDWRDEALQSESESSEPEEAPKVPEKSATKVKESSKTSKAAEKPAAVQVKESVKDQNRLNFEARPDWHAADLPILPAGDFSETGPYRSSINNLNEYAKALLEADSTLYASKHLSATSSHRFLATIMSSGTLSDKISALTLVVQESPVHTTRSFESLLDLAKKRSRGQAVTALGAMKDLLGAGVVLPADRRLRTFASQPGLLGTLQESDTGVWKSGQPLPGNMTKAHLISWAYEDWLKESYFDMLKILEVWCSDEVEYARSRAVMYVYELLKDKPEQESNLLRLLVNKLGDPDKKIASRSSYLLMQLQTSHPLMKPIIINSIENELILRPGQSSHAKYYAINTLNQTILSSKEEEVAKKLLSIYFGLFVSLLKKPEVIKPTGPKLNKKGEIQGGGGAMGKKAKEKLTAEEEAKQASEETTEKMISAVLTGVNRAFPFTKTDDLTLEKHMDTLFRITHSSNFNTSIQALMLIEQLSTTKHLAVDRFYRTLYESLLDPRLITSSKHALYLNLLYRALKSDVNIKRVKAFTKRMLQVVTLHQPPFICGIIYLLRELEVTFPGLKTLLNTPEANDEEEEEVYRDVPEEGETADIQATIAPSKPRTDTYDGKKRDPEHSNADKSCLWEIIPFLRHFPSIYRFVYRNAKAAAGAPKGSSLMQPLAGGASQGILVSNRGTKVQQSVNSEAFWRKKAEDVAVDEVFFHKYFNQIGKGKDASKKKEKKKGEDGEDDEDEDEDEIWQALVESKPDIEGPESDDDDLNMDDFDMSEDDSEGGVDIEGSDEEVDVEGEDEDEDMQDAEEDDGEGIFSEEDDDLKDSDDEAGSDMDALFEAELQRAKSPEAEEEKKETSRSKKRKLKNLPTFASAEDYAAMLDKDDGDEDMGMGNGKGR